MRTSCFAILVLFSTLAYGVWSQFAHVTPETADEFDMHVCISYVSDTPELARVVFPLREDRYKEAWLIISKSYLRPQDQKFFRHILWGQSKDQAQIDVISKIENNSTMIQRREQSSEGLAEVFIARHLMSRAYIYIDFPTDTADGGYYYSIDLSAFRSSIESEC